MQEVVVCWVIDPAFDRDCIVYQTPSVLVIHLKGAKRAVQAQEKLVRHTFMKNITHRAIIQNHNPTQIRLDRTQILNVRAIPERAMLPIIPAHKKLALLLEPVDDRVGVLLHAGREDDEFVPFADFAQEVVAVGPFVDVVQDWVLRAEDVGRAGGETDGHVEFDFDHVAAGHAAAFGEGVDEGFVEVNDEGFLG